MFGGTRWATIPFSPATRQPPAHVPTHRHSRTFPSPSHPRPACRYFTCQAKRGVLVRPKKVIYYEGYLPIIMTLHFWPLACLTFCAHIIAYELDSTGVALKQRGN